MKERPILFSGPMVKAILEGRKTQTRRIINPQPTFKETSGFNWKGASYGINSDYAGTVRNFAECINTCPHGRKGDRLWVRETFRLFDPDECGCSDFPCPCPPWGTPIYKASNDCMDGEKWKPSIHMPRSASRILLEITKISVERLNSISRTDAAKEGLHQLPATGRYVINKDDQYFGGASSNPVEVFSWLWEDIAGNGSWAKNPWVWVVEFKVIQGGKE